MICVGKPKHILTKIDQDHLSQVTNSQPLDNYQIGNEDPALLEVQGEVALDLKATVSSTSLSDSKK